MWKFKKIVLLLSLMTSASFAEVQPLFYETYNFEKDDVLNIREQPNYKAKKIGELGLHYDVDILECRNIKTSKWCKIESIYATEPQGWVNAKFLQPKQHQEGYVTVKGKKSTCDYVIKCEEEKHNTLCLVVTGFGDDMNNLTLQTKWFNRKNLKPASRFTAMYDEPEADGYCNADKYIYQYQSDQKIKELSKTFTSPAFTIVGQLMNTLRHKDEKAIQKIIHPKSGLRLSALSYFDKKSSQHFSQKTFLENYNSRNKLFWGHTEAKGDVIQKDLYAYLEELPSDVPHISKVIVLNDLKNYPKNHNQTVKAYEIYWTLDEEHKEYAYQGLVVILEQYENQWYLVGITKDYWTP
ncbi:MAG: Unknown protein [uncultured Sulfurovum sp.]|uniref:SH3b domain-containing protein n=1 Tax=uncultured Sulfurovum sp. TaxID=269237 RepID=A0A6S6TSQ3_9BACT|nr:MAG: Unknown protein [uncultured Sulfurovum sp.]